MLSICQNCLCRKGWGHLNIASEIEAANSREGMDLDSFRHFASREFWRRSISGDAVCFGLGRFL